MARAGTILLVEPGSRVTRPSITFCVTYEVLLSSIIAGSVREMSPGIATTSLPPSLIAGAAEGASLAGAWLAGAWLAGDAVLAAPWQAANRIAVTAITAPVRIRIIRFSLLL